MAQRIEIADVTITKGTAKTSPATFTLTWREGNPRFVEIRFPPGPSGLVGIQLLHSGRRIIPKAANTFLVTDDELVRWELEGYPYNAVYTVRGYNEGVFDHTIQFRFGFDEVGTQQLTAAPSTIPQIAPVSPGAFLEGLEVS
jgi:hypothetical protein